MLEPIEVCIIDGYKLKCCESLSTIRGLRDCLNMGLVHVPNSYLFWFQILISIRWVCCCISLIYVCYFVTSVMLCVNFIHFIVWSNFRVLPSRDRVFLEDNWLFFLLSLVAGVEGLTDVLVWIGLERSWSSITMSWVVVFLCDAYHFFRIWWILFFTLWVWLSLIEAGFRWN